MKFEIEKIKNFGVIKENKDKIVLNDLTIFMGENSAGKSYLAILFNLLTKIEEELNLSISLLENKKAYLKISEILENFEKGEVEISLSKDEIFELKDILEIVIKLFLKKHFKKLINNKSFDLKINYYEFNEIKSILKKSQSDSLFEFVFIFEEEIEKGKKIGLERKFVVEKNKFNIKLIIEQFFETLFVFLVKSSLNIPTSVYLPAARTGYLHTYPILWEYAVKKTFSFNKESKDIELPEWIRRFILELVAPAENISNDIATEIEKEILKGEVKVYENESRIEYYIGKKKVDIPYTSSSVSELIPLVVFLKKGKVHRGSLLIIEEPEAHLSFKNQRKIARIIALLVNKGVKVLITTHSDFLIYELNNLIIANKISDIKRPNEYKNLSLNYKKINIYNFLFKGRSKKSIIEQVPVKEDGIDNKYITKNLSKRVEDLKILYDLMEEK